MLERIKLFFQLFKAGTALKSKEFWTRQQAYVVPVVVSVFVLCINLAQTYGIQIPAFLDQNTLTWIAGAIYMVVNTCITIFSHEHLGLPSRNGSEALQTVPSASTTGSDQEQSIVPPSPVSGPSSRFDEENSVGRMDEATLRRATEWVEQQKPSYPGPLEGAG